MKLSKQERIGVLIILAVVIIALGVFLFIVPAAEQIDTTMKNLTNKENEYNAAAEKAARKEPLRNQIIEAYKDGEHIADMFFPEMKSYEAEAAAREFILQCEANIVVTSFNVTNPGTSTLSTSFPTEREVTYALKQNATQGVAVDEAIAKRLARINTLRTALGNAQTIGSSVVSFTVRAESQEELTKFVDEINSYFKDENGVMTRKAVMLTSGYSVVYDDVSLKYAEYQQELQDQINEAGQAAIDAGTGGEFSYDVPERAPAEEEEEEETNISETYKTLQVTLTFYSIERMQDPEPQLNAQDGITTDAD